MSRVAIVTDSTADLPPEICAEHAVTVVPLNLHIGDTDFRDQVDISTDQFLHRLAYDEELPTTSHPAPAAFRAAFESLTASHDAIVAVLMSSKLSGCVQSATIAASQISDRIPVEVVDSYNVSLGLGFQVLRAAELAAAGESAPEIAKHLHAEVAAYNLVFFVDTLDYLKRGGRIGGAASLIGSLLQLKPVLRIDEGQVVPYERTRTRLRAIDALREFVVGLPAFRRLGVIYSQDRAEAEQFVADLPLPIDREQVTIAQLGPVLSAHVGPGVMGVCVDDSELI